MLKTEHEGGLSILRWEGSRLDSQASRPFKEGVESLAAAGHHRLILDMSNLQFVDSSGLGALVAALKSVSEKGDLQLCGLKPPVMSLLKLTRMDRIFRVHDNLESARANFA